MAKKNKKPSEYTVLSTRYCDMCKVNIKIGLVEMQTGKAIQEAISIAQPTARTPSNPPTSPYHFYDKL
ncbi:hypothetical protein K443DRAFT_14260 [Laccaria amethystina LaAM-08-1]|uniref:Uncharacterized protein n=1 Tax=Laccaria amethystina LaAM-08-1 TaxID=1095629 RepID=A0A0C9X1T3_9AGAR|nr:hypothetical protein K443DRAFT_14260 [Laccaria amethystina LaAM-08-1]